MNLESAKELIHKRIGKFGCNYEVTRLDTGIYKSYPIFVVAVEHIEGEWETIIDADEIIKELTQHLGGKKVRFAEEKVELLETIGLDEGEMDDEEIGFCECNWEFAKLRL